MQEEKRRIIDPAKMPEEINELTLRPKLLKDFIGQDRLKSNLKIFIDAAKSRNESLDHLLFYGPPGLGKTTLSQIVAQEMGVNIRVTSGPMLSKTGELAAILTNLQKHDVLFIDEIHRLNPAIEELLYPAMEDYAIDLIIGEGAAARTVKINLQEFTLIGSTTRLGMISNPLRDRFGIPLKLELYAIAELQSVITRAVHLMKTSIKNDAAAKLALCSRGTPRIAIRLLRRVRDFAHHSNKTSIDLEIVHSSLVALSLDTLGLDKLDYDYMHYIAKHYNGGPVGIETISAGLAEDKNSVEEVIEPYLMQIGFLSRTSRGRVLTKKCMEHIEQKQSP